MMNKRTIVLSLAMVICQLSFAQGFTVKEFKQNLNDGSAFHAPTDAAGQSCGLIKVRTDDPSLQFKGDIVGDVENKMNEYWVYVSSGSQSLRICHPNFLPVSVLFSDYGIEISPKATYVLTLTETKYKKGKTGVTLVVKPEDAELFVDDILVDNLSGNGFYQLYLPKGDHIFKLSKLGYRPNVQVVQSGKASQNVSVELESVLAELEVMCKTVTAEIYIDGELKGNGTWKGKILAGDHKIEAHQQNFNPHIQVISLLEKEKRAFTIPELKRSMGKICIVTEPSNLPVIVDGKTVGNSPCTIDVETGKHYASCKLYGTKPCRANVEVNSGDTENVRLIIEYEEGWRKEDYQKGYNGNTTAILNLACQANLWGNYEEAVFWIYRHPDGERVIANWLKQYGILTDMRANFCNWILALCEIGNPEKALELFPYIQKDAGDWFSPELEMSYIGAAFYKKKNYDKAIPCFLEADKYGYEGLGDCYANLGEKQRAASYYRKVLDLDYYDGKNRVEKKLKELGY